MIRFTTMAYPSAADMMFGRALHPVTTRRNLVIGGGEVIPELVVHPRPGSERDLRGLLREFERAHGDALERCIGVGHPSVVLEDEHVLQMTQDPGWGAEIAAQTVRQIDEYRDRYGLRAAYRSTIADIRRPAASDLRDSPQTAAMLESFRLCAQHADIVSIESIGGKELSDHCLIRNDLTGLLFAQSVLGARDMEWLWPQIVRIAREEGAVPGGDTDCAQANTAMFMAGGLISGDVSHCLAALTRAISISRSLVAYECGALGPGKDCGYENVMLKAITGFPMSMEGKSAACAHSSLCGNVMAATCDLWANEAVEYHQMFGGTTPAVFAELLGYDVALLNSALELGHERALQDCLIASDRHRNVQAFILCPDNAWELGRAVVQHPESCYARGRAAALRCGELILADPLLQSTAAEKEALTGYLRELSALPDAEADFIDLCLQRYGRVKGFSPSSYGL